VFRGDLDIQVRAVGPADGEGATSTAWVRATAILLRARRRLDEADRVRPDTVPPPDADVNPQTIAGDRR